MYVAKIFSLGNFQKAATNSDGIFIISSFTLNDENLWVVFSLDKQLSQLTAEFNEAMLRKVSSSQIS